MNKKYLPRVIKRFVIPTTFLYALVMAGLVVSCYVISNNTLISNKIEIWIDACQYIDFFLPLAICVVFVPLIYMQNRHGFIKYASIRASRKRYILSQIFSISILVFIGTIIAYYFPLIISLSVLKPQDIGTRNELLTYVFGKYQVYHPYLFGFAWCIWKGIIAAIFAVFGCLLALYLNNLFVAVLLPFLYCMAENLVTSLLQIPQYSIMTSYVLNRLSPSCMNVWNYLIGAVTFTIFAAVVIFILKRRSQDEYSKT
ncbi:MAG: hypothetical protein K2N51_19830 [Lachnospiraceae bacterium]|nr:hypothetical protein [Lachnospiraceae bacterium]